MALIYGTIGILLVGFLSFMLHPDFLLWSSSLTLGLIFLIWFSVTFLLPVSFVFARNKDWALLKKFWPKGSVFTHFLTIFVFSMLMRAVFFIVVFGCTYYMDPDKLLYISILFLSLFFYTLFFELIPLMFLKDPFRSE